MRFQSRKRNIHDSVDVFPYWRWWCANLLWLITGWYLYHGNITYRFVISTSICARVMPCHPSLSELCTVHVATANGIGNKALDSDENIHVILSSKTSFMWIVEAVDFDEWTQISTTYVGTNEAVDLMGPQRISLPLPNGTSESNVLWIQLSQDPKFHKPSFQWLEPYIQKTWRVNFHELKLITSKSWMLGHQWNHAASSSLHGIDSERRQDQLEPLWSKMVIQHLPWSIYSEWFHIIIVYTREMEDIPWQCWTKV